MRWFRVLWVRFIICVFSVTGFLVILNQVHDYQQTRLAYYDYVNGDGMRWKIVFYFMNEAASGIKYAATRDKVHLAHFPTAHIRENVFDHHREYREALVGAVSGSWAHQLQLSHYHALGWADIKVDRNLAGQLYLRAEEQAKKAGETQLFEHSQRRKVVYVLIKPQLEVLRFYNKLPRRFQIDTSYEKIFSV